MNEILGDHNVDKQMTDSRGDVCIHLHLFGEGVLIIVFRWPTSWPM